MYLQIKWKINIDVNIKSILKYQIIDYLMFYKVHKP
jgi:hypothetical protein